jgi:hypothetical protein
MMRDELTQGSVGEARKCLLGNDAGFLCFCYKTRMSCVGGVDCWRG